MKELIAISYCPPAILPFPGPLFFFFFIVKCKEGGAIHPDGERLLEWCLQQHSKASLRGIHHGCCSNAPYWYYNSAAGILTSVWAFFFSFPFGVRSFYTKI